MSDLHDKDFPNDINLSQIILLNELGQVICSDDTLFDSNLFGEDSVLNSFPLLESIFNNLIETKDKKPETKFKRVETSMSFLPGYYDFKTFCFEYKDQNYVLWKIYDLTDLYSIFQKHQQHKNEIELSLENLKFLQDDMYETYVHDKDELLKILETDKFKYSDQIEKSLNFNQNPIEGFNYLFTHVIKDEEDSEQIGAVQRSVESFSNLVVELENLGAILKNKKTPVRRENDIEFVLLDAIAEIETKYSKKLNVDLDLNIDVFSMSIRQPQFLSNLFRYCIINSYNDRLSSQIELSIQAQRTSKLSVHINNQFDPDKLKELSKQHLQLISLEIFLCFSLVKMLTKYYQGQITKLDGSDHNFIIQIDLPLQLTESKLANMQ